MGFLKNIIQKYCEHFRKTSIQKLQNFFFFSRKFRNKALQQSQIGQEIKVLEDVNSSGCRQSCRLLKLRLHEEHALISILNHKEGTNFSTRERVACFHLFIVLVMAVAAWWEFFFLTNFH